MDRTSRHENLAAQGFSYDRATQNLIEDVKVLSADTRELLRQTAEQSGEHLARVRDRARETLSAVEARLSPLQQALAERGRYAARISAQHVREHPLSTLAAAAAIGLVIAAVFAWNSESQRERRPRDQ